MLKGAVARRYAAAVFDLASRQHTLDRTLDDVQGIAQVFSHRKIAFLLREPKVLAQRKERAIREAIQSKVLPTSLNLALLLIQRDLVDYTSNIAKELEQMVRDYRNEAVAEVTTATPMDSVQSSTVQRALAQRTGKTIIVHPHIDPNILGGVIARVGDQLIDGSVRYRLSVLQQQLLVGVANSHTDFFSQEELTQTAREIGAVDTNGTDASQNGRTAQSTPAYSAVHSAVPGSAYTETETAQNTTDGELAQYTTVPRPEHS